MLGVAVKSEGAVVLGKRRTRSPTQRAGTEKRRSGRSSAAGQQEEENGQKARYFVHPTAPPALALAEYAVVLIAALLLSTAVRMWVGGS